jgi:hypothetical protein
MEKSSLKIGNRELLTLNRERGKGKRVFTYFIGVSSFIATALCLLPDALLLIN